MTRLLVCLVLLCSTARAGTITGRVVQNGFRVAEYGVSVTDLGTPPLEVHDGDGRFTLRDVPPGKHVLALVGWAFVKTRITIELRETLDLGTIVVEEGRRLRGRVVDAAGDPVSGATVLVFESRPVEITAPPLELMAEDVSVSTSDYEGNYTISGVPDTKGLRIMAVSDDRVSAEQIVVGSSAELVVARAGTIEGKVTNRRAMASPIILATLAGAESRRTIAGVDPSGNFRFELPAGVYHLAFPEETAAPLQVVVVEDRTRKVTLTAPTQHADLVVDAAGCTYVRLLGARPTSRTPRIEIGFEVCERDRTRFPHLPPGVYGLCVDTDETAGCRPVTLRARPVVQTVHLAAARH